MGRLQAKGACAWLLLLSPLALPAQWVSRDDRWPTRGPWMWSVSAELPDLYREFNGIDFGHAHLAETLLRTQDQQEVERARVQVLDFIFSSPVVPPDEEQIAPTLAQLVWETQKSFNWAHKLHRSLYDLFASDEVRDKEQAYRRIMERYLSEPEAITTHRLDHHGKLWSFPESKAFRDKFRKFNSQIWAYHWLQGAAYDVQLMGNAETQRRLMRPVIEHYHGYLRKPPVKWEMMPMVGESAPEFARRFPEATAVFDNLHMLHDNMDDVLSSPELYSSDEARRRRILEILEIYLHRNHEEQDRYAAYDAPAMAMQGHAMHAMTMGPRPPSARRVLEKAAVIKPVAKKTPHKKDGSAGTKPSGVGHQHH